MHAPQAQAAHAKARYSPDANRKKLRKKSPAVRRTDSTGVKPYEYRSTLTHIRGRVHFYAANKPVDSAAEWRKARSEPGKLLTGVIVGSVVIAGSKEWKNDGFRYKLEAPKRLRKYLVPNAQPMPKFFKPRV